MVEFFVGALASAALAFAIIKLTDLVESNEEGDRTKAFKDKNRHRDEAAKALIEAFPSRYKGLEPGQNCWTLYSLSDVVREFVRYDDNLKRELRDKIKRMHDLLGRLKKSSANQAAEKYHEEAVKRGDSIIEIENGLNRFKEYYGTNQEMASLELAQVMLVLENIYMDGYDYFRAENSKRTEAVE